jgi:hypothetical protein
MGTLCHFNILPPVSNPGGTGVSARSVMRQLLDTCQVANAKGGRIVSMESVV